MNNTSKTKASTIKDELTKPRLAELHQLARAQAAAEEAKEIRRRFKAFLEDHQNELRSGYVIDGLRLGVHLTAQLTVEEV